MAIVLYPVAAYFLGLYLRAAISRIVLKELASNWPMIAVYICTDISVLMLGMRAVRPLAKDYVLPVVGGMNLCMDPTACALHGAMAGATDLAGLCALALIYVVLRWMGRVRRRTAGSVACFAVAYLGLAAVTLTANYMIYPYVDAELETWGNPGAD